MKRILLVITLILLVGCGTGSSIAASDFDKGHQKIIQIDLNYQTDPYGLPNNISNSDPLLKDLESLQSEFESYNSESLKLLIDFRVKLLKAFIRYGESKADKKMDIKDGFACSHRPFLLEGARIMNESAIIGFDALSSAKEFRERFPVDAEKVNFKMHFIEDVNGGNTFISEALAGKLRAEGMSLIVEDSLENLEDQLTRINNTAKRLEPFLDERCPEIDDEAS